MLYIKKVNNLSAFIPLLFIASLFLHHHYSIPNTQLLFSIFPWFCFSASGPARLVFIGAFGAYEAVLTGQVSLACIIATFCLLLGRLLLPLVNTGSLFLYLFSFILLYVGWNMLFWLAGVHLPGMWCTIVGFIVNLILIPFFWMMFSKGRLDSRL